jgi:hypothetical protein
MPSVPVLFPAATGVKVTDIAHLSPALNVAPQVLVWEKPPLTLMLEIVSGELPILVSVTVWALLLVPTL